MVKDLLLIAMSLAFGIWLGRGHRHKGQQFHLGDFRIMYILKDDQPDVPFTINPGTATDAEGNPVDAGALVVTTTSDNDAAISIVPGADQLSGSIHVGAPGDAAVTVSVTNTAGTVLGKFGAQFHVTAGDPAAIAGGEISFSGITEAPTT